MPQLLRFTVMAVAILIGSGGWWYYTLQMRSAQEHVENDLDAIAKLKMNQIASWRNERLVGAINIKTSPSLRDALRAWHKTRSSEGRAKIFQRLAIWCEDFQYVNMMFLDTSSSVVVHINDQTELSTTYLVPVIRHALTTGKPELSDVHYDPIWHAPTLDLVVPVDARKGRDTTFFGVVVITLDVANGLFPLILNWPVESKTAETILVHRQGDDVEYLNDLRHQKNTALKLHFPLSRMELPAVQAVCGTTGIVHGIDYQGQEVLASLQAIPNSNWFIVAKIDLDEALEKTKGEARKAFVVVALFFLAVLLTIWLLWRELQSRQMRILLNTRIQLQESEERFRIMFQKHSVVMLLIDIKSGSLVDANEAAAMFYGYSIPRLRTMNISDINTLSPEIIRQRMVEAGQKKERNFTFPHRLAGGEIRMVDVYSSPIRVNDNDVLVSIIHDVTVQQKTEEALQASEDLFRNAITHSGIGIALVGPDKQYLRINPAFCAMVGYTEEEILASSLPALTHPDDKTADEENFRLLLAGKSNAVDLEQRYIHKSGRIIHAHVTASLVRDANLQPKFFISQIQDITKRKLAEEKSILLLERLNVATRAARMGIWDWDVPNNELLWDDQMYALYGIGKESFGGAYDAWLNGVHPDDRRFCDEAIQKALTGEEEYDIEFRILWPNGSTHYIKADGHVTHTAEGKPLRMTGTNHDITERKRAEEETRSNAARLKRLVDILQHHSESIHEFLDYALDQAIGMTTSKIGYIYFYSEEKQEFVLNTWSNEVMNECTLVEKQTAYTLEKTGLWGEAVRQRQPVMVNDFQSPHPLKKGYPEGHAPLHRFLTVPIFSRDQIVAVVGVANKETDYDEKDILQLSLMMKAVWRTVDRKRAEEALKDSEQKYRRILENISDIYMRTEISGIVDLVSPSVKQVLGYDAETDVLGHPSNALWAKPELREQLLEELDAKGRVTDYEITFVKKDGTLVTTSCNVAYYYDEQGRPLGVEGMIRDISERKRVQQQLEKFAEELERSNTELERFAYIASHDLQEPLRMVSSYTQLLARRYKDQLDQDAKEFIGFAVDGAARMQNLIKSLLTYSRMSREKILFEPVACDVVIGEVLTNLKVLVEETHARIDVPPLPVVRGHHTLLAQLFQNLINNALKFRKPDVAPSITIRCESEPGRWLFSVADNGIGIESQYYDRIFAIFQRLHTIQEYTGTGIGLALCKKTVERHGGKIWLHSIPAEGTTFFFSIPKNEEGE
ncbi:MAG: PAS domain S-box protein [Ignavibacteriales bacterium]|nr:PAS domain S-box protein [Ignavibacteriales bacterium]